MVERQANLRGHHLAQSRLLAQTSESSDRALGAKVEAFVTSMPEPDSQRLILARELRAAKGISPAGHNRTVANSTVRGILRPCSTESRTGSWR